MFGAVSTHLEIAAKGLADDIGGCRVPLDGAVIEGLAKFRIESHRDGVGGDLNPSSDVQVGAGA